MHAILSFLEQLEAHNTVERMHAHQPEYKAAKIALENLSQTMINQISAFDSTIGELYPAETIFRLAKDTRFSKDKSPYKTNMGIVIAPGGKKSIFPCYYIHLQPGNRSFLACGLYRPEPNIQTAVRDRLVADRDHFQNIITEKKFTQDRGLLSGDSYKRIPSGYEKDHPAGEFIKHKDRLVRLDLKDTEINTPNFVDQNIKYFSNAYSFNYWIHEAILMSL